MTRADRIAHTAAAMFAAAVSLAVQAAPFADPTRPPNAVPDGAAGAAPLAGPRLESVLIAPNRRVAVISGRAVPLGGSFGEARLVKVSESEVVLQTGEQRETLKLFPDVDKKSRRPPRAARKQD